jgi:hypothetical protein
LRRQVLAGDVRGADGNGNLDLLMTTSSPKKTGMAFWATVVVVGLLVAYPLSCGPIVYLAGTYYDNIPEWGNDFLEWYFLPLEWTKNHGPEWLNRAIEKYESFWDG